jgi:hypothetical protein
METKGSSPPSHKSAIQISRHVTSFPTLSPPPPKKKKSVQARGLNRIHDQFLPAEKSLLPRTSPKLKNRPSWPLKASIINLKTGVMIVTTDPINEDKTNSLPSKCLPKDTQKYIDNRVWSTGAICTLRWAAVISRHLFELPNGLTRLQIPHSHVTIRHT